jgi:hypothetical protein
MKQYTKLLIACIGILCVSAIAVPDKPTVNRIWNTHTGYLLMLDICKIDLEKEEAHDFLVEYQQQFDHANYEKYANNEFESRAYNKSTIAGIKAIMVNYDTIYTVQTSCKIGQYDFKRKGFPLLRMLDNNMHHQGSYFSYLPPSIYQNGKIGLESLYINEHEFWFLPMSDSLANAFLKERTTPSYINRIIDIDLHFRVMPQKTMSFHPVFTERSFSQWAMLYIEEIVFWKDETRHEKRAT